MVEITDLKLTSTTSKQLKQLGSPGQRSVELIRATLSDCLSERHAELFADPVPSPAGDRIDWLTELDGPATRLSDLPDEDADTVRIQLTGLVSDILSLADTLENNEDKAEQRLGEALRNAVEIPDEADSIFVVETPDGDAAYQPVLVNWAHRSDMIRAQGGILSGRVPVNTPASRADKETDWINSQTVAPVQAVLVDRSPHPWWWLLVPLWLTVAVLTAWLFWLMIPTCGLNFGDRFNFCPNEVVEEFIDEREQIFLLNRIDQLEREFAILDEGCAPPPEPEPEARLNYDIKERLDQKNAQEGELTVTLAWDNTTDLDMHLTCPGGETINYNNRNSCGGILDLDANGGSKLTSEPVEHIVFENPSLGEYRVQVYMYKDTAPPTTHAFSIRIQIGSEVQDLSGFVNQSNRQWIHTLTYGN